jgi:2-octaprenylphenol hydroxylase
MKYDYDILIVGGGMVGASLALALSQTNLFRIGLIEALPPKPLLNDDAFELRVSALTAASEHFFKQLGIWSSLSPARVSAFADMHVWEVEDSFIHFEAADLGQASLGHIIENRHLQSVLWESCRLSGAITLLSPAKPTHYEPHTLTLDTGERITAELIVAADGGQSPIRQWAGLEVRGWDYQQHGLVCNVTTEQSHDFTAWQRFLPGGPLAFLPLADPKQSAIVWSLPETEAVRLLALPETDFITELSDAFEHKLGKVTQISQRASFPLKLQHAKDYDASGLALVGDAAHTIHPLAGQGVNIGLLDAMTLSEILIAAKQKGRPLGDLHTLSRYQRKRKADNWLMQLSMDAFKRVFGSSLPPIRWLRRQGFQQTQQQVWLKNLFMTHAASRAFSRPHSLDKSIS